jgi:hypothetical protein
MPYAARCSGRPALARQEVHYLPPQEAPVGPSSQGVWPASSSLFAAARMARASAANRCDRCARGHWSRGHAGRPPTPHDWTPEVERQRALAIRDQRYRANVRLAAWLVILTVGAATHAGGLVETGRGGRAPGCFSCCCREGGTAEVPGRRAGKPSLAKGLVEDERVDLSVVDVAERGGSIGPAGATCRRRTGGSRQ